MIESEKERRTGLGNRSFAKTKTAIGDLLNVIGCENMVRDMIDAFPDMAYTRALGQDNVLSEIETCDQQNHPRHPILRLYSWMTPTGR